MTARKPVKKATTPPIEIVRKDGSVTHSHGAKRGYSRPPFEPGHTVSLVHGAFSPAARAAEVEKLEPVFVEWIEQVAPWAAAPEFGPARANYLRHLAVVELLFADVMDTARRLGTAKVPTRRFETLLSALRGELSALGQLGLTPPTRAELAQTVASVEHTLSDLAAQGGAALDRRNASVVDVTEADPQDQEDE